MISMYKTVHSYLNVEDAETPSPLAPIVNSTIEDIEDYTRLDKSKGIMKYKDLAFTEELCYVDVNFFKVFTFQFIEGDENGLLDRNNIIITDELAKKYFGDEDPVGKKITIKLNQKNDILFIVAGVIKKPSSFSSIQLNVILPYSRLEDKGDDIESWKDWTSAAFILLKENSSSSKVEDEIQDYVAKVNEVYSTYSITGFRLNSISDLASKTRLFRENPLRNNYQATQRLTLQIIVSLLLLFFSLKLKIKTKYLLYAGGIMAVFFWIMTFVCGFVQGGYNHASMMVSELGALGTNAQQLFTWTLIFCSFLSLLFFMGLYRVCKAKNLSVIPLIFILSLTISLDAIAMFPSGLKLHASVGMPAILIVISPITAFFLWKDKVFFSHLKLMSSLSVFLMLFVFLLGIPDFLPAYEGLLQRCLHLSWSVWFFYLSFSFIKLIRNIHK